MRAIVRLVVVVAVLTGLAVVVASRRGPEAFGRELLPDLTMSVPTDLRTEPGETGEQVLRFTAVMNNLGAGDLIVDGSRSDDGWTLVQRIPNEGPGFSRRETAADLVWGGDGHDHWHVVGAARYRLEGSDGPLDEDRFDHKAGFCIFDSVPQATHLPRAPGAVAYESSGCGLEGDDVVAMGLSVGWGDRYRSTLPGQWIDISGLAAGRYRLVAEVDPDGLFAESDTANNEAWVEFALKHDGGRLVVADTAGG